MCRIFFLFIFMLCVTERNAVRIFHERYFSQMNSPKPMTKDVSKWFTQKLNHFDNANNKTWQQRYFVNETFYKPGGPIFVMIGGEGTANPIWMKDGEWIMYAQKYGAMCWMLEHRFYGESHPTVDLSTLNLRYLSSEQALADLANFITTQMSGSTFPSQTKVITFGGSYPGSLSAWFRLKYPHIAYAAVATSAPILAKVDFTEYLEVVQNSLLQGFNGAACVKNINSAFTQVSSMMQSETGRQSLKTMFKMCDDIDVTSYKEVANVYSVLVDNFNGVVQYNKDNRAFEGAPATNITIRTVCELMTSSSADPLSNMANLNNLLLGAYNITCLDISYSKMISEMRQVSWNSSASEGGRQWTYQTCTEFGFYQTSDSAKQPFGQHFPVNFSISQCSDIFGADFTSSLLYSGVNQTNQMYGGVGIKVSRVIFPNGSIDPWHALGVTTALSPSAYGILINGTAHCANMYPPDKSDSPQLVEARAQIVKQLGEWISSK